VIGATPAAETASKIEPWAGAFLPVLPSGAAPRIAVVGSTVATDLGLTAHDLGSAISINGVPYTVIGLLQQKGGFGIDTAIYVPLDTARTYITGGVGVDSISVTTTPDSTVANVEAEATAELHARHRIGTGKTDDFTVTDLTQILSTVTAVQSTLVMLLAGIAGISLLVGGIGVMNIMLVSVRERTREIGVRRAIGARRRDILIQFLVESMVLTFVGGLIGILFGEVAAAIIARIGGWGFTVDIATIGIATAVSVIVGVVFGVLPARQASRLDPVEALRYE
jgi:putative ABC transport system permease protein